MRILVVNVGSSSAKLRVVEGNDTTAQKDLAAVVGRAGGGQELRAAIGGLAPVDAVGHRVVHGGTEYRQAVVLDDEVVDRLSSLADLAPLHQPASMAGIRAAREALPAVPHIACFDTAFHATIPEAAATYALPQAWRDRWPIRRFGFHGLSHEHVARRAADILGRPQKGLRIVTAHLGAGASLAAVDAGRSVDTTMGFTPLEGLVMATRSGSVDPGLLLWLQQHAGFSADAVATGLERESGLLGLAGTADMRELLAAVNAGSAEARLARDVYVHRLGAAIASMAAAMNGLDVLVFTGGVGENAPTIRHLVVDRLGFLGLSIDAERNVRGEADREIGAPDHVARILVVRSREELEIARQARSALGAREG